MLRRILITIFILAACGDDQGDDCSGFQCTAPMTTQPGVTTAGSTTEASTGGENPTTGEGPYCTAEDNVCVGPDAIKYCDEQAEQFHTIDCQAVCGMDSDSQGCMLDEQDEAKCFCGPPGSGTTGTTGDDVTTGTTGNTSATSTTGNTSNTGSTSSTSSTTGDNNGCDDPRYPVYCKGQHGVPAGCWTDGTDCATVVECPFGHAACHPGSAVDCVTEMCIPQIEGFESTNALCSNGQDDDGDDKADCDDPLCHSNPNVTVCAGESTDYECSNGDDDDGDGYVDCGDLDCTTSLAVTVCGAKEWTDFDCSNGSDDDGDGYVDCDDYNCFSAFTTVCWG